jgi:hypothetical protein
MGVDPIDRKEVHPCTIRLGGLNYRAISREIVHGYLPTSAIVTPLLVQSIIKKYFEDARSGWFKLSCHIAGVYSWLSSHFCIFGNFVGPIDRKEVLRGHWLWMVKFIVSYRGSLFMVIFPHLQLWHLYWSNLS